MCLVLYEFVLEETLRGMILYESRVCAMYCVRYYGLVTKVNQIIVGNRATSCESMDGFLVIYLVVRKSNWFDNLLQPHTNRDSFHVERSNRLRCLFGFDKITSCLCFYKSN